MEIKLVKGQGGKGRDDEFEMATVPNDRWVARVRVITGWRPREEDNRRPATERPLPILTSAKVRLLGVNADQVDLKLARRSVRFDPGYWNDDDREYWVISKCPFAVVRSWCEFLGDSSYFFTSRQVHKGELGQRPRIRMPKFYLTSHPLPRERKDQPIKHMHFARLGEVAELSGLAPVELIQRFARFSPSQYNDHTCLPIHVGQTCGADSNLLMGKLYRVYTDPDRTVGEDECCYGETEWRGQTIGLTEFVAMGRLEESWVLRSWATDVLTMTHFGYMPEVNEEPNNSFVLEATVPGKMLSGKEMPDKSPEELTELTRQLPAELTEKQFKKAAEEAIGQTEWYPSPHMDDQGEFVYYCEFKALRAFNGRLVVAICFWSRGGAEKSDNYWSAQISIHAQAADGDPRRDPNTQYKLWISPGGLVRVMPEGSVGGLFPPEIEPELMAPVRSLVERLGYQA